jgi:hypothetical protein
MGKRGLIDESNIDLFGILLRIFRSDLKSLA